MSLDTVLGDLGAGMSYQRPQGAMSSGCVILKGSPSTVSLGTSAACVRDIVMGRMCLKGQNVPRGAEEPCLV